MSPDIELRISNITPDNKVAKLDSAIESLAKALDLPKPLTSKLDNPHKEEYFFLSQQELRDQHVNWLGNIVDQVYLAVCKYLDLPVVTQFRKAEPDEKPLIINGQVKFNPESGKPLTWGDFNKLVASIERFLNRKLRGAEKKLTLSNAVLGRLLGRMANMNKVDAVRTVPLEEVRARGYSFEDLSSNDKLFFDTFKLTPQEKQQYRVVQEITGEHIRGIGDSVRKTVKEVYWEGIRAHKSKKEIAQDLFDRAGTMNRDIERIVETESANYQNEMFVAETVASSPEGEKSYFKRMEVIDAVTCKFCQKINNTIALFVPEPLASEEINDPVAEVAIWPGKSNVGRKASDYWVPMGAAHPYCRGQWIKYDPEKDDQEVPAGKPSIKQLGDEARKNIARKSKLWGEAMTQAEKEWAGRTDEDGNKIDIMKNRNRTDPAFLARIDELYREKLDG
jgi:hypothetical protein